MNSKVIEFRTYLRKQTMLAESTVLLYARVVKKYFEEQNSIEIEKVNEFLVKHSKDKRSYYMMYAFQHFFKFTRNTSLIDKLIRPKIKERVKKGVYVEEWQLNQLIAAIDDQKYKDMATLHRAGGRRAREIVTIREENITWDDDGDIKVILTTKGGSERPMYLKKKYEDLLRKYCRRQPGFLFIDRMHSNLTGHPLEKAVSTMVQYYHNALGRAKKKVQLYQFASHDFRRNFAERLRKNGKDIFVRQAALGHANINTTARYHDRDAKDIRRAILEVQP